ncbi:MAG: TetR family transcriptional regulator [Deltaproteobacteria bacterium HGW-Deltaproteobacteria-14]|jgi:TetR/AcrR family transcriptional regulator|nr:MAG: TetR family transcriptional regulator [Deltaproteobacteria bacterium HGW-Deltaproteobacteria-14]
MSPSTRTRPKRSAERTRANILEAAIAAFAEHGFEGARIDAIAAAAASNKRMIYVYFESKEGLYDAVMRAAVESALVTLRDAANEELPPEERTRRLIRGYMHFLADHPRFVRLVSWESLAASQRASVAAADLVGGGLQRLAQLAERGVAEGAFQPIGDVRHLVAAVHGMCLGFFQRRSLLESLWGADLNDPGAVDALADVVVSLVLDGLRRRPAPADRLHPTPPETAP